MTERFATTQEIIMEARRNLSQDVWDYLVGASESETTLRRNRLAFDSLALRPRVLVDVSSVDLGTTFLGHKLRIPVMTAPIGSLQAITPEGGFAAVRATAEFGTIPFLSSVLEPPFEKIAASTEGPKILQLYIRGDDAWLEEIIARVKAAGFVAICVTVDNAQYGRRERQLMSRYLPPSNVVHPERRKLQARLDWKMLDRIKELSGLPTIVKGVATAEDARIAVEHGMEAVYVSNHGGRTLDHGRGTMAVLPEVVDAVAGRAEILLDGGVTRGTDVLKAIALGATAVTIGRLQGWGLAAGGADGLRRVLEILEDELAVDMALLGVTAVSQIGRAHVCEAPPVTFPHEMSAFPHLPGGRLL